MGENEKLFLSCPTRKVSVYVIGMGWQRQALRLSVSLMLTSSLINSGSMYHALWLSTLRHQKVVLSSCIIFIVRCQKRNVHPLFFMLLYAIIRPLDCKTGQAVWSLWSSWSGKFQCGRCWHRSDDYPSHAWTQGRQARRHQPGWRGLLLCLYLATESSIDGSLNLR